MRLFIIIFLSFISMNSFAQMDMNKTENLDYLNRRKCTHCKLVVETDEQGDTTKITTIYDKKNKKYRHGWAIFYHANGHILEKVKFKSNYVTSGTDYIFNSEGNLRIKSTHKNGITRGKVFYFNPDKSIRTYDIYKRGFNKKDLKTPEGKRIHVIYTANLDPIKQNKCTDIQQKYRVYHYNISSIEDKKVEKIERHHNRFAKFMLRNINGKGWYEEFLQELTECQDKHY